MSFRSPTAGKYLVVGILNFGVAFFLALRQSWTAVYFGLLALGSFWCAIRARPSRPSSR